jgi:hypothetical protein
VFSALGNSFDNPYMIPYIRDICGLAAYNNYSRLTNGERPIGILGKENESIRGESENERYTGISG